MEDQLAFLPSLGKERRERCGGIVPAPRYNIATARPVVLCRNLGRLCFALSCVFATKTWGVQQRIQDAFVVLCRPLQLGLPFPLFLFRYNLILFPPDYLLFIYLERS